MVQWRVQVEYCLKNCGTEIENLFIFLFYFPVRSGYCAASVNKLMGFAVSFLIVEENFMTETKPKVEKMIDNIRRAFNNLVRHATWMDWETKEKTLQKSQKMKSLIGKQISVKIHLEILQ